MSAKFDNVSFSGALSATRDERGLSWRQVADRVGLEPSTVTRIAAGKTPSITAFALLLDWLGRPADDFFATADHRVSSKWPNGQRVSAPLPDSMGNLSPRELRSLERALESALDLIAAGRTVDRSVA